MGFSLCFYFGPLHSSWSIQDYWVSYLCLVVKSNQHHSTHFDSNNCIINLFECFMVLTTLRYYLPNHMVLLHKYIYYFLFFIVWSQTKLLEQIKYSDTKFGKVHHNWSGNSMYFHFWSLGWSPCHYYSMQLSYKRQPHILLVYTSILFFQHSTWQYFNLETKTYLPPSPQKKREERRKGMK